MHPLPRLVAALIAVALFAAPLRADDLTDVRSQAGARLFRALLSADTDIDKKTADGKLLIVFLYVDDQARAAALARRFLGNANDIHGIPLAIEYAADPALAAYKSRIPAGVFIAQPLGAAALKNVVGYGIDHHLIVYSPFEGNVESGVTGGLAVEAQVRPYVNLATLTASSISLKPLFFKVTKVFR